MAKGDLVVKVRTDSSKFAKGMRQNAGLVKNFAGSVVKMGGALLAVAGAAGFGAMLKSSASTIDALAKTADRLGTTTEGLAGLRQAAELTGAGVSTLDTGLEKMAIRVSKAAQGTGQAQEALKQLGLDAAELSKLSTDEQFNRIAKAFQGVESATERTRLAYEIFGRSGTALVNTLALGKEGLAATKQEAIELGTAVNRQDAAKIESMNDAFFRLGEAFKGIANKALTSLAPAFQWIADTATPIVVWLGNQFKKLIDIAVVVGKFIFDVFSETFGGLIGMFKSLTPSFSVFETLKEVIIGVAEAFDTVKILFLGFRVAMLEGLASILQGSAQFAQPFVDVFVNVIQDIQQLFSTMFDYVLDGVKFVLTQLNSVTGGLDGVISSIDGFKIGQIQRKRVDVAGLGNSTRALADQAGKELQAALVKPSFGERLRKRFEASSKNVTFESPEFKSPEIDDESNGSGIATANQSLGAAQRGSAASANAILASLKGGSTADKQLAEQKKTNSTLKSIDDKLTGGEGSSLSISA